MMITPLGTIELFMYQYLLTNLFVHNNFFNIPVKLFFPPSLFLLSNRSSLTTIIPITRRKEDSPYESPRFWEPLWGETRSRGNISFASTSTVVLMPLCLAFMSCGVDSLLHSSTSPVGHGEICLPQGRYSSYGMTDWGVLVTAHKWAKPPRSVWEPLQIHKV